MNDSNELWFGFLDAGDKSSPVLIDRKLDTGNPKTVYMYNLKSRKITEYKREIAEPKLRALNAKEAELAKDLKHGYDSARKEFTPRNIRTAAVPAAALAASPRPATRTKIKSDDEAVAEEFEIEDSDIALEEESEEDLDTEGEE